MKEALDHLTTAVWWVGALVVFCTLWQYAVLRERLHRINRDELLQMLAHEHRAGWHADAPTMLCPACSCLHWTGTEPPRVLDVAP